MTVTPAEIDQQLRTERVRSDFRRVISRYVLTLNRNQFSAEDAGKFARWRQAWYDEAAKRVGVHTLALSKEEDDDG